MVYGGISAYVIILLFTMVISNFNTIIFSVIGSTFFAISSYTKIAIGVFNKRIHLDKNPDGYWYIMGSYLGFILFGIIL